MANVNGPFGLRPRRHLTGASIVMNTYTIASGYNANIGVGDVVEMTGTGKNIARAADGNVDNIGVFGGCKYKNAQGEIIYSPFWPANTVASEVVAYVYDDPNIVFEAQFDTLAENDIGALCEANWSTDAVNVKTGQSGTQLLGTGSTGTSDKALRILGIVPAPYNEAGAYARGEVLFIEHVLRGVVAGVGGI